MKQELITNIKGMEFWAFLAKKLPAHYTWGTKISINDLISWSKELEEPLFRLPKSQHQLAVTIFRCILRVCGDEADKPTARQKERARLVLLKLSLEKGPRIRDEIILQLVKQIRGNTNKFSAEAAWATLASVTSIASPSDNFSYPLMHWLIDIIDLHENKSYKEWGRFILARLYNNLSAQDKRVFVPESNEISYIINKRQIKAPLFMPNGAFMTMFIESYTDFETMKKTALYRMGLHTDHVWRYGIMEVVEYDNKYEERFLENHFNVLDTIASWAPLKAKDPQIKKCSLCLCITATMPYIEGSELVSKFQFEQYAANLYRGKIVMTNSEIGKLSAIHFLADHPKLDGDLDEMLERKAGNYIPITKSYSESSSYWTNIMKMESKPFSSKSRVNLIKEYMKIVSDMPSFGSHYFSGKFRNSSLKDNVGIPIHVIIAVWHEGIVVLEEETKQPVLELDYMEITNWGCSKEIFVFSLGEIHCLNKFYFELNQAPMLIWLMNTYANLMVNQPIEQVSIETKFKFIHDKKNRFASAFSVFGG